MHLQEKFLSVRRGVVPGSLRPSSSGAGAVWLRAGGTSLVAEGSAGGDATTSCRSAGWESSAGAASIGTGRESLAGKPGAQSSPWHSCNQRDVPRSSAGRVDAVLLKQAHMACVDVIACSQWILN